MNKIGQKNSPDTIKDLIEAEEKDALAKFRAGDFQARLENRIKTAPRQALRPSLFRVLPQAIWISAAALILLGSAAVMYLINRTPAPASVATFEDFLHRLPGIQTLEGRVPASPDVPALPASPLEKTIAAVLSSRMPPVAAGQVQDQSCGPSSIDVKAKPMDLQELYDILIMNKSIERALTLLSQKTKEG